ncbi:tRNA preQ1(34) S-adenosylmethionine ribosyltransferase-isomerase QueA [Magnetovirga frankeli]|uniref:tRNA preQ1(34) S-adenosylmethionine ribosyltransferase-isomerase QueA n=1 Tax=Magnetovirga frankeli TaxID=947516 RepID=UPI001293C0E2|nr:tRNA preQ1(34) S-adenosylmethionine ribosyltransferase-isomerase QueA [gamma proteobacterium SS-5]
MRRSDFHYPLPERLIAHNPSPQRGQSRLLHLAAEGLFDRNFSDLEQLLRPGDLLVLNNTRVMRARLYGQKESGGRVEILLERLLDEGLALAQVRASKPTRTGVRLKIGAYSLRVEGREAEFFLLRAEDCPWQRLMEEQGHIPLPPYIQREDTELDEARYQTVFARHQGAVAAPTAGLHFDQALLARLQQRGVELAEVTLHVGAGTFQPVRVDDIASHQMHEERLEVSAEVCAQVEATRCRGGRVVAVGTTCVRSLETAAAGGSLRPYRGETRLFITPGYGFRVVDALITNFHLPESTLLMLVSAFAGHQRVMAAYAHAVEQEYRFFSYGDAMFLERDQALP